MEKFSTLQYTTVTYCEKCQNNGVPAAKFCWHCGGVPSKIEVLTEDSFSQVFTQTLSILSDDTPHKANIPEVLEAIGCDDTGLLAVARQVTSDWYTVGRMTMKQRMEKVREIAKGCENARALMRQSLPTMADHNEHIADRGDWAAECVEEKVQAIGDHLHRMIREEFGDQCFTWNSWRYDWTRIVLEDKIKNNRCCQCGGNCCGSCKNNVDTTDKFCSRCGNKLKG